VDPSGIDSLVRGAASRQGAKRDMQKRTEPARSKMPSLEEISSSLLLPDEGSSSSTMPGLEELSGSLLLDDPTELREDLRALPLAEPSRHTAPLGGRSRQTAPPAQPTRQTAPSAEPSWQTAASAQPARQTATMAEPVAPPPAAHRALLGMPQLPTSTPGPNMDGSPRAIPSAKATLPPATPDTEPHGFPSSSSLPTAIAADIAPNVVPPPPAHMYEALQGYESAQPALPQTPPAEADETAPFDTMAAEGPSPTAPVHGDVEVTSLPRSRAAVALEAVREAFEKLKAAAGEQGSGPLPQRRMFLAGIALAGLAVGVAVVAIAVLLTHSLTHKPLDEGEARTESSASAAPPQVLPALPPAATSAAEAPQAAPPAVVAAPPAPATVEASTGPCKVVGKPRVVAPSAIVSAGIEVRTVGNDVALGFAPNEHQATALRVDAASLSPSSTVDTPSADAIRRVVPLASTDGALTIAADADHDGDALRGRRTAALDPAVDIGAAGGDLVWAHPGGPPAGKLWPLDGDGNVEALRAAVEVGPSGPVTAIAMRRGRSILVGTATGRDALVAQGPLSLAGSSTGSVGSPAVAINEGVVIAAWADRASPTDPWRLRWVRFNAGEAPGEAGTFTPPAGGKGEQAMSPGVAAVPGGRFLLVWTEGPATRHDVRALTLSREGQPIGKPLVISNKTGNSGQGQAAVNPARQGMVAFLESNEGGFQVMATPIACAP
jgi:hypothetical protein